MCAPRAWVAGVPMEAERVHPRTRSVRSMRLSTAPWRVVAALVVTLVAACSSDPAEPVPTMTVGVAPATVAVLPGTTGQATVTVTRSLPSVGTVDLEIVGLPAGVTATLAPAELAPSVTTSTVTFAVAANATAGQVPVTVRATSEATIPITGTIQLNVLPPPTIALAATVPTATLANFPTATGTSSAITLTRSAGLTVPVDLTIENAPAGWTVAVAPTTLATGVTAATVSITVPAGTARGSYTFTVRGRATGVQDATVVVTQAVN